VGIDRAQTIQIARMTDAHWHDVSRIYAQGIATGLATFESEIPSREKFFESKIPELSLLALTLEGTVAGWAAATAVSQRPAYQGVVEHSVYVDHEFASRGIGTRLLTELISLARHHAYWMVQSSVIADNNASRLLHGRAGFREVGRRERIAQATQGDVAGQWLDTYLYELRL